MRKERLNKLRYYREMLIECKKNQLSNYLSDLTENQIPTFVKNKQNKQKVLSLFK